MAHSALLLYIHYYYNSERMDIIDNPVREGQQYFIMCMHDYTWVVPFVVSDDERVVLKTAFRSRKYHKIYGGSQ